MASLLNMGNLMDELAATVGFPLVFPATGADSRYLVALATELAQELSDRLPLS